MTTDSSLGDRLAALEAAERSRARDRHGLPVDMPPPLPPIPESAESLAWQEHQRKRSAQVAEARRLADEKARADAEAARRRLNPATIPEAEARLRELDRQILSARRDLGLVADDPGSLANHGPGNSRVIDLNRVDTDHAGRGKQYADDRQRAWNLAHCRLADLDYQRSHVAGVLAQHRRLAANAPRVQALEVEADELRSRLRPIEAQAAPIRRRLAEIDTEVEELQ